MKRTPSILKDTLVGGLIFLVPFVLLSMVAGRGLVAIRGIAEPVASRFPQHAIAGVAVSTLVAGALLLLACYLAGVFSRTRWGGRVTGWFEESLFGGLPMYRMAKGMAEGLSEAADTGTKRVVLASIEDAWQIGFIVEELEDGWLTVFLPQAPTLLSGNVMYLPAHRVRPIDLGVLETQRLIKHLGAGSAKMLKGVDLGQPV